MNKLYIAAAFSLLGPIFSNAFATTSQVPLSQQMQQRPGGYYFSATGPNQPHYRLFRPASPQFLLKLSKPALYTALAQMAQARVQTQLQQRPGIGAAAVRQLQQEQLQQLRQQQQLIQQLNYNIEQEQQQLQAALQQLGAVKVENSFHQLTNMLVVSGQVTQQQLEALPGVLAVYPAQEYQVALTKSVPQVKAPAAWLALDKNGKNITGTGVRIAVLDTGVDFSHPALGGCFGAHCKVVSGYNTVDNNNDITDVHGHGTHVAATAAGKAETGNGVAPDASIVAVKVLDDNGYGSDSSVIAGIEWAVDPDGNPATNDGVDVINMSLGGPGDENSPISQAADAAVRAGVVVVAAAGNGYDYLTVGSPAVARSVIAVANVDQHDTVNYSSSRGPVVGADFLKPEIAAPGTDIKAAKTGGGLKELTGTSMASPHVAGAAALLLQASPELTPAEVKKRLMQSADLISGNPAETGSGRLNIQKALTQQFYLDQTALVLGRIPDDNSVFSGERTVSFVNPTAETITVEAKVNRLFTAAFEVSLSATVLQIPANSSGSFILKYQANSADIPYPDNAGGADGFHLSFSAKGQTLTLPVMFEKYQALDLVHDGKFIEMRFYDADWNERYYAAPSRQPGNILQLRLNNMASLKYVYSWASFIDPKDSRGSYIVGVMLKPMPALADNNTLEFKTNQFTEYHKVSQVQLNGQAVDFAKPDAAISNVTLLKEGRPIFPTLNSFSWHGGCSDCDFPPIAFMTAGFDSSWSFEQAFQYPENGAVQPETMFFSWQAALGQGSKTTKINFTDTNLLKFQLIPGKVPSTGGALSYTWPTAAKAGDIMRVYQTGTPVLPETAPQIRTYDSDWRTDAHSGYFSATAHGTVQKWLFANSEAFQLTPALDLQSNTVPLSSSLNSFAGDVVINENRSRILLSLAPRVGAYGAHVNVLWYDQYLNAAYFNRDNLLQMQCNYAGSHRLDDFTSGVWRWNDANCEQLTLEVDSEAAKLLPMLPRASFQAKADGLFPQLRFFRLHNNGKTADIVSRLNHQLSFEVLSRDAKAEVSEVIVEMQTASSGWRIIYQHAGAGVQQLKLPMQPSPSLADLRITVRQNNGNQSQQLLPAVFTIGLGAGGDNDVDGDGIANSVDADNDNDTVPDSSDALPFDASESLDHDKDGQGNNADPDDDNDGYADTVDAFPLDATEWLDTDKDGSGNNTDSDDDNDSYPDSTDVFPLDVTEWLDADKDGIGNNADTDDDNDSYADLADAFPLDNKEWLDTDKDNMGNNADTDDDNDSYVDGQDAFPLDATEWLDSDKDGTGNNADTDDDNDGTADSSDKYPLDASRQNDPPVESSGGGGGAGLGTLVLILPLLWLQRRRRNQPLRSAA